MTLPRLARNALLLVILVFTVLWYVREIRPSADVVQTTSTIISFDEYAAGTPISTQYAGATFVSPGGNARTFTNPGACGEQSEAPSAPNMLVGSTPHSAITITFPTPVTLTSVTLVSVGHAPVTATATDSNGTVLNLRTTVHPDGPANGCNAQDVLSYNLENVAQLTFTQENGGAIGDGYGIDDLRFVTTAAGRGDKSEQFVTAPVSAPQNPTASSPTTPPATAESTATGSTTTPTDTEVSTPQTNEAAQERGTRASDTKRERTPLPQAQSPVPQPAPTTDQPVVESQHNTTTATELASGVATNETDDTTAAQATLKNPDQPPLWAWGMAGVITAGLFVWLFLLAAVKRTQHSLPYSAHQHTHELDTQGVAVHNTHTNASEVPPVNAPTTDQP